MSFLSLLTRWTGSAAPPPPKGDAALRELNTLMHSHYNEAKKDAISKLGPVIVTGFSEILLVWDGRRELVNCYDDTTANLKFISHTALAINLLVSHHATASSDTANESDVFILPETQRTAMKTYHMALAKARARLDVVDFTPEQRERQKRIIETGGAIAESLTSEGGISLARYEILLKETQSLAMVNADDAASRMLNGLNGHVGAWRELIGPAHWKEIRVVVCGGHQSRSGNFLSQYFERLLHGRSDDYRAKAYDTGDRCGADIKAQDVMDDQVPRLFFIEGGPRPDADRALDFLAAHTVDAESGEDLYGDPRRLHRDVLADASSRVLDGMTLPAFP